MHLAKDSRSLATLMANFPESFRIFYEEMFDNESNSHGILPNLDMSLDLRPNLVEMLNGVVDNTS